MVTVNGSLKFYRPEISAKTPIGHEIADNITSESLINFTLEKCSEDGEESKPDERFLLGIKNIKKDKIVLNSLPGYIENDVIKGAEKAVFNVHSLETDYGEVIKNFEGNKEKDKHNTDNIEYQSNLEYSGPPTRELLESITADAIESLGYEVASNTYRETTGGDSQEVDVWAEHPRTNFSMYASCKNWKSRVGRPTVQEEIGRIEDMKIAPQLRVLIVGTMTDEAETSVETNGFIPITLGEKADEENAEEIYQDVHSQLRETLLAIAPPDVENIANQADEIAQELRGLSEEIRNLESNME